MDKATVALLLAASFLLLSCSSGGSMGEKSRGIVFFGDSITRFGAEPGGYVTLIRDSLLRTSEGRGLEIIGAGKGGNRIRDLLERADRDVLSRKPLIVVIYIGINDVWNFNRAGRTGTPKKEYESQLKELVGKFTPGAHVILCTLSVIGEKPDGSNTLDTLLDEYSEVHRSLARTMEVRLCDLRSAFIGYLKLNNPGMLGQGILTKDGVHLNDAGNRLVADELLGAIEQELRTSPATGNE